MKRVTHLQPVSVSHPLTEQFVTVKRGDEFSDSDPIVSEFPWLFTPDPVEDDQRPIETASAAPGERRPVGPTTRRTGR
jgi:hypothetical protein